MQLGIAFFKNVLYNQINIYDLGVHYGYFLRTNC